MRIVWSTEARRSLRAIQEFIGEVSPQSAAHMVTRIIGRVDQVSRFPTHGHPVHEIPKANVREVHASPYRIIYEVTAREVRIVTIVHFRQRLQNPGGN